MLTRKQFELLRFIHERLTEAGVPPSFDEMKDALDLRSKSGIHRLITALEERGFIRRLANRARAIEVIKLPDSVAHGISGGVSRSRGFNPSVIEGDLGRGRAPADDDSGRPIAVPVMGRIAGCKIARNFDPTFKVSQRIDLVAKYWNWEVHLSRPIVTPPEKWILTSNQ